MTKPTEWMCAQRRLSSAWSCAQSDQSFRCQDEETLGPYLPIDSQRILRSSLGAHAILLVSLVLS